MWPYLLCPTSQLMACSSPETAYGMPSSCYAFAIQITEILPPPGTMAALLTPKPSGEGLFLTWTPGKCVPRCVKLCNDSDATETSILDYCLHITGCVHMGHGIEGSLEEHEELQHLAHKLEEHPAFPELSGELHPTAWVTCLLSSGKVKLSYGKDGSSTMCQWNTFNLL